MKKLLLVISMVACIFGMTACASKQTSAEYDQATVENVSSFLISNFTQMTEENLKELLTYDSAELTASLVQMNFPADGDVFKTGLSSYLESMETLGKYVSTEDTKVHDGAESGTLVAETLVAFENQNAKVVVTYAKDMTVSAIAITPVFTIDKNLQETGTKVFVVVGIICELIVMISLIVFGPTLRSISKNKKEEKNNAAETSVNQTVAQIIAKEQNLVNDMELVAVISAAIAASTGTSPEGFVVRSIKKSNRWRNA